MNAVGEKALNVKGGSSDDETVTEIYKYGDWESQKWTIEPADGNYYKIENSNSGLVLDVKAMSSAENGEIIQYSYNGGWNQQWEVEETSDGYYRFKNRLSGLYLGVKNNGAADGDSVVQVSQGNDSAKWFMLVAD